MFSWICIALAFALVMLSYYRYKVIAFIIFAEFFLHQVVVNSIPTKIQEEYSWTLFLSYATLNFIALYLLKRYKPHTFIMILILVNLSYNIIVTRAFFTTGLSGFYHAYEGVVGAIMIIELLYMVFIGRLYAMLTGKSRNNHNDHLDHLLCNGTGLYGRGAL